ncbi:MAG: tetratricopeptide repeat protein [Candidatus Omnitrophica bacterium]|nr:tetratricopeptide repeat protein [Candidatus Omnitrophota bacterium]
MLVLCLALTFPVGAVSNEKELFVVAQRAFEDGFYDVSLRYVAQLLQEFPHPERYVETRLLEGQCYFFKKEYLRAFNVFKELVEKDSYRDASLFWLGETYLKGGDYDRAREQYRRVTAEFPSSIYAPQAYYSLAWSYFEKGGYEEAKSAFQDLVEKFPSNNLAEDAAFKIGECEYNAGQYEGAIFRFGKYLKDFPSNARVFEVNFNIAESYYYLDQYDKALDYYKKAQESTKSARNVLGAMIGQGWSLVKLTKFDEAIKSFNDAQSFAGTNNLTEDEALVGKASLFNTQEKYQDALASYSDLIQRFPASSHLAESYLGRANTYYSLNDYTRAIADYGKVVELFSSNQQYQKILEKAQLGLAWTYLKSGDLKDSIATFQTIFNATDNKTLKVSTLIQMGDAYQEAGQLDNAIEYYDRILKEMADTPYNDYVQYRLGVALLKSGKLDAAVMAFQSLEANYPKSKYLSDANYYLGMAYFKKKDWAMAAQVLEAFIKSSSTDGEFAVEARYILGLSYLNLKQLGKAATIFTEVIKRASNREDIAQGARLGAAKAQYEQGAVKEAVAIFKEIVFKYPDTDAAFEAFLWLGRHEMSLGIYQLAIEYYSQALGAPGDIGKKELIYFEIGRAYHALGQFDKALENYRHVGSQSDVDLFTKARLAIADIFSRELDPSKAIDTYQNIISASPEFARDAYVKMAQIYRRNRQYADELKVYESALQAPKGDGEIVNAQLQFYIGDTYEVMGERDRAVEAYFKVPYLYEEYKTWVIKAYLRIAKIFENREDWSKALSVYQKVLDMKVDESKFAEERMAKVREAISKSAPVVER